jgi:hypothetical protein
MYGARLRLAETRGRRVRDGGADQPNTCLPCTDMTTPLLTEGDLDRGRPPELKSPHWRCSIVDPATGATCTLRPHTEDKQHQGRQAVQGAGRSTHVVTWTGVTERAMVIDGYTWTRIPEPTSKCGH